MDGSQDHTPQKEPLFENSHVRDKAFFSEFYSKLFLKNPLMIACMIVTVVSFTGNVMVDLLYRGGTVVGYLLPPIVIALYLISHFVNVFTSIAQEELLSAENNQPYLTRIYEDELIATAKGGEDICMPLSKIKKVVVMKRHICLATASKQYFPIRLDGFEVGTFEDFCAFLRARGLKLKIK